MTVYYTLFFSPAQAGRRGVLITFLVAKKTTSISPNDK